MPRYLHFRNGIKWRITCDAMSRMRVGSLDDLRVFLRAAELGGFSLAARELHLSAGAVSKQIARLERALGVRLFERSTRQMRVTDEGRAAAEEARHVFVHVDRLAELAARSKNQLSGVIRVTAPAPLGRRFVAPALAAFRQLHPEVELELRLSDHILDLMKEELDLALRIGKLKLSSLIARPVATYRRVLVASPGYLGERGHPRRPADLRAHSCLVFAYPGELQNTWSLLRGARRSRVEVSGPLRSDSGDVLHSWCAAGLGISLREPWDVFEDVAVGRLVRVLPDWQSEPVTLNAVRVHRDRVSRRVEVLIEFLRQRWRREPWAADSHGEALSRPRTR
jgi:DNA-binding transcriptional LysR family regulator